MKKLAAMLLAAALSAALTVPAYAGVWREDGRGWWYDNQDGTWLSDGWHWIDGNNDGTAECYYFGNDGYLLVNTVTPDGYQVNGAGQWTDGGAVVTMSRDEAEGRDESQATRPYAWMNGLYKADDGRMITLDAAGGNTVSAAMYGYSEDGWNTSYVAGQVNEDLHAIIIYNEYGYYRINIDGEATSLYVQTYDSADNFVGSWFDGEYTLMSRGV